MDDASDRNLLFGILAVQLDYIRASQFVEAANQWMLKKNISLGEVLVSKGFLSEDDRRFIQAIVEKHISRSGSPHRSLEMLEASTAEISELRERSELLSTGQPGLGVTAGDDNLTVSLSGAGDASIIGERFTIIRELARGGLGEVFVARDRELDREVARKKILEERRCAQDIRDRFVVEAKITGGLEHPGIVPVYGLGAFPNGAPFYAMRLIRGRSLQDALKSLHSSKKDSLSATAKDRMLRGLIRAVIDACNAVGYANSRGVIHRDIKPHNIMIGKFGETLIVDWGLAKATGVEDTAYIRSEAPLDEPRISDSAPTAMGSILGTYAYMSPEQANGRIDLIDRRSDVFSLGATLFAVLTGRAPYKEDNLADTLAGAKSCQYLSPREYKPTIPRSLEAICIKAMAKERKDRYDNAVELADDLDNWIADAPVAAFPEPLTQRTMRFARKHQVAVASAFVFLCVASVGLLLATWAISKERNIAVIASQQANEKRKEAEELRKQEAIATERAQHNSDVSTAILEQFVKNIVGNKWASVPNLDDERLAMVNLALDKFKQLSIEAPNDLKLKKNVCQLYIQSGNLYLHRGNDTEATQRFEEAYLIAENLNQGTNSDKDFVFLYSDSLYYLASNKLSSLGAIKTLPFSERLLQVCEQREKFGKTVGSQKAFIRAHLLHSAVQWELNKGQVAFSEAKAALEMAKSMPPSKTDPHIQPIFSANALLAAANAQLINGSLPEALALGNESLKTAIEGYTKFKVTDLEMLEVEALNCLANVKILMNDVVGAEALAKTAIPKAEALSQDWPKNVSFKVLAAESHLRLCMSALRKPNRPAALAAAERTQEILDSIFADQPMNQSTLPIQLLTHTALHNALIDSEQTERRAKTAEAQERTRTELQASNQFHPALKIVFDLIAP